MVCDCADTAVCAHRGIFRVSAAQGNTDQLIFVASQPGIAWTPVGQDRVLAYVSVTNEGPRAVQLFWDGGPPSYMVRSNPTSTVPTAPTDQFAPLFPGNSMAVVVDRALKLVYAPTVDPADIGDHASGYFCITYCCPEWAAPQLPTAPPVAPPPAKGGG